MANQPEFHPNFKDPDPKTGLYCFLDQTRECNAACMAYDDDPPTGDGYTGKQFSNCRLLVAGHRAGKHLVILAEMARDMTTRARNEAADHARKNQPPPPVVR